MNEQDAIKLCIRDRDPRGFEYLVTRYRREAFRHALGFLGNHPDAEDAVQESFARAYARLPGLRSLPAFYPWFYTILKNGCLNRLRNAKPGEHLTDENGGHAQGPQDDALENETSRQVWRVLKTLKPEFREILLQKHLFDASYDDISHLLGIPRGTVMSRLYHARKAFQEKYQSTVEEM